MPLIPEHILALTIDGDDLVGVPLRCTAFGVRRGNSFRVRSAITAPGEVQRFLRPAGATPRLVLTLPASWSGIRPIALTSASWASARQEIERSVDGFFPFAEGQALVGLIDRNGEGDAKASGGYLVAAERARVDPWLSLIETAAGRSVHRVMPAQAAVLGLGLQNEPEAEVIERLASGAGVVHRLHWGRVRELGAPLAERTTPLPRLAFDARDSLRGEPVSAEDLAVAGALAGRIAPGSFAPLSGPASKAAKRWLGPVAALIGAGAVVWFASGVAEARFARAASEIESERAAARAALDASARLREEADRLESLIRRGIAEPTASWRSVLPDLLQAQRVVGDDGFLHRIELDGRSVSLVGEARRTSDVLRRLEEAPEFVRARTTGASVIVEERGTEQFSVRADRVLPSEQPREKTP